MSETLNQDFKAGEVGVPEAGARSARDQLRLHSSQNYFERRDGSIQWHSQFPVQKIMRQSNALRTVTIMLHDGQDRPRLFSAV